MADNEIYEVDHILGRRVTEGVVEYLIRWKGFTTDWDTWEPIDNLLDCLQLLQEFEQAVTKQTLGVKTSPTKKNAEEAQRFALDIINKSLKHQAGENEKDDTKKKHKSPKTSPKLKKGSPTKSTSTDCLLTLSPKSPTSSPKKLFSSGEYLMCCSSDEKAGIKTAISDPIVEQKRSPTKRKPEGLDGPKQPTVKKKKIDKDSKCPSPDNSAKTSDTKKEGQKTKPGSSVIKNTKKVLTKDGRSSGQKTVTATSPKSGNKSTTDVSNKTPSQRKSVKKKNDSIKEKTKKQIEKQSLKMAKKVLDKSKARANKKTVSKKSGIKSKTKDDNGDVSDGEITFPKLKKSKPKKAASSPDKCLQSTSPKKSIGSKEKKVVVKNKLNVDRENKKVSKVKEVGSETKSKKSDQKEINSKLEQGLKKSPHSGSNFSLRINLKSTPKSKSVNLAVKKQANVKSPDLKKKDSSKYKNDKKATPESKSKTKTKQTNEDVDLIDLDSDERSDLSGDESLYDIALKAKAKAMAKKPQVPKKASPNASDKIITTPTKNELKQASDIKLSPVDLEESPRKKMRLIDSMKAKKNNPVARSVSPTPLFTTVKPLTTSLMKAASSETIAMESLCGDVPTYQYFPAVIPISPSSMSYRMFLENLPQQLHPKQGSKSKKLETGDSPPEEVERRISIRQSECAFRYKDIVVKKCAKYTQIWMNTHTNIKNVLNPQVIQEIVSALNSAKYDDSNLVMFSGLGNVFCNGIDLHYLISGDKRVSARQMVDALRDFTKALITFPKPIVAVVTGSAVGLGMTMLPLCDVVYASDKATFHLPYAQLSQTPEGCATYTLPSTVGMAMANELLIAGRKITAIEACQLGLVSQVFWPTSMMQEVIPRVQNMALLSGKSLETTKLLIRSHQRTKLELTNESESNLLLERWSSFETQKAIENYLNNEKNFTM